MLGIQTLDEFYRNKFEVTPRLRPVGTGDFNVFRLNDTPNSDRVAMPYSRRDFYKIMLIRGKHRYHYADKTIAVEGTTLLFFNPAVPYRFERIDDGSTGFFCIFKESFFTEWLKGSIQHMPVFASSGSPSYHLNESQDHEVALLFKKMLHEIDSDYRFKYDLLRNIVMEIIHFALKMNPNDQLVQHADTNARITALFIELLERQFPVESPDQRFTMRSARDFANKLAIHVNHLNRAVRLTTGKTTTSHIASRMAAEAIALLKHTDWNVAEISYSLGFTQPSHFTYFFKNQTGVTPTSLRLV